MTRFFDPATLARTYRDPVALIILGVDLFPIIAVLTLGWGLAPLVFLYWLENLVIGAFALARMIAAAMKEHPIGLVGMVFLGPFFTFHYGMFCFVHGIFLHTFAYMHTPQGADFMSPFGLIGSALSSGHHMTTFLAAIIGVQIYLFIRDFIGRGEYRETDPATEMAKPYGRVVVLHIAIFAGAAAMAVLGEPLLGVLGLILLRALWGMVLTIGRRRRIDRERQEKVDASSSI